MDVATIHLRYEVVYFRELQTVNSHHVIIEDLSPAEFNVRVFAYRLDRAGSSSARDSTLLASGTTQRAAVRYRSPQELLDSTMTPLLDAAIAGLTLVPTEQRESIAGLPSIKYELREHGRPSLFVWIAESPARLADYQQLAQLEAPNRNGSFLFFEFFRSQLRAMILRGIEYPPASGTPRSDLLVTRIDSGVRTESLLARDNSFVFELKSIVPPLE